MLVAITLHINSIRCYEFNRKRKLTAKPFDRINQLNNRQIYVTLIRINDLLTEFCSINEYE